MTNGAAQLSDAPEFEDAIRSAAIHHGILPDLVRKDYWVTRVLQALATDLDHEGRVLFRGGTSLSKGWQLIDRISEDVARSPERSRRGLCGCRWVFPEGLTPNGVRQ